MKRVVIKVGSHVLSDESSINQNRIDNLCKFQTGLIYQSGEYHSPLWLPFCLYDWSETEDNHFLEYISYCLPLAIILSKKAQAINSFRSAVRKLWCSKKLSAIRFNESNRILFLYPITDTIFGKKLFSLF